MEKSQNIWTKSAFTPKIIVLYVIALCTFYAMIEWGTKMQLVVTFGWLS